MLILASAILILAFAVFVIRFASNRFPAPTDGEVARGDVGRSEIRDGWGIAPPPPPPPTTSS